MSAAGFLPELAKEAKERRDKRSDQNEESSKALRERKADEIEQAIKNIQARGSLQQGQAGYIAPEDLKKELSAAQQQLTSLYQPHEAPDLLKRVKGIFQKPPAAQQGGVLKPGMTLNDVLAMGGPAPTVAQAKTDLVGQVDEFKKAWKEATGQDPSPEVMKDFISKKGGIGPTESQKPLKQQYVDAGLSEEDADKAVRIHFGLEPKANPKPKGFKYDKDTDEVVNEDTGQRFTRADVAKGVGGETVARMFEGQKAVQKKKDQEADIRFDRSIQRLDHAFKLALDRNDHAAANRYVVAAKNDLVQARTRMRTMDENQKDALNGNQQAMLSLVANHIGMTLGAQKGARITRAVWEEAIDSAPWLEVQLAKSFHQDANGDYIFDGWKSGVTLTKDQIDQMVGLAHQKVDTLSDQVKDMQDTMSQELTGGQTPPSGDKPPAPAKLTPEEQQIVDKLKQ